MTVQGNHCNQPWTGAIRQPAPSLRVTWTPGDQAGCLPPSYFWEQVHHQGLMGPHLKFSILSVNIFQTMTRGEQIYIFCLRPRWSYTCHTLTLTKTLPAVRNLCPKYPPSLQSSHIPECLWRVPSRALDVWQKCVADKMSESVAKIWLGTVGSDWEDTWVLSVSDSIFPAFLQHQTSCSCTYPYIKSNNHSNNR